MVIYEGNPPVTSGFPSEWSNKAEGISMSWRHHALNDSSHQHFITKSKQEDGNEAWINPLGKALAVA